MKDRQRKAMWAKRKALQDGKIHAYVRLNNPIRVEKMVFRDETLRNLWVKVFNKTQSIRKADVIMKRKGKAMGY